METHLDKKFYVPSIEEFYIGFEFEHKDPCYDGREEFQKAIVESDNLVRYPDENGMFNYWEAEHLLSNILYDIKENNIRVKYLDTSDIESIIHINNNSFSIKFKLTSITENELIFQTYWIEENEFLDEEYIYWDMKYNQIKITHKSKTLFYGFIKNKSEFKKVLNMLNIK